MLSDRIKNLSESETLAMNRLSRELKANGHDVINLSIGQPDFNTPDFIKNAAKEAIDENYTGYPPVAGYADLREAVAEKFKRDNNLFFTPDQIVVSTGAKQSLTNVIMTLVNPGEEVIIPTPYWVSYKELVKLAEGKTVFIPTSIEADFKITPEQVEAAITEKTKLFIFSSPCNPTGSVYTKEELHALAEVFARHPKIYVIADEIYEYINFVGFHESLAQFENIRDRVITVNGVSKGFAMTGWRLGYIGAPRLIANACVKLQGQMTSATCSISQRAAIAAVLSDPTTNPDILCMKRAFLERRDVVIEALRKIPGVKTNVPEGAFYIFPDIREYFGKTDGTTTIKNAANLSMYLLNKVYVAVVPGDAFGDPNCIRFSYATSMNNLKEALRRIAQALSELH